MKYLIPLTTIAVIAASGAVSAQTPAPAYSKPSGYVTKQLLQGFNVIGLTLLNSPNASGAFETITQTTFTDNQLTFVPIAGRTYVLEFVSGATSGAIFEVPAANISGTTITITTSPPTDLTSLGFTVNDQYNLRLAPTLEDVFTTTSVTSGGILQAGISSIGGDVVWVPSGPGTYNQYFLHTSGEFRVAGTTTASPNVPLVYTDGIFVQKKGTTAASLTVTGQVKTVGTTTVIGQGFNLVTVVAPAGATLANAGFEDDIQPGISEIGADIIWIQQPDLAYKRYFRHTTGNWRDTAASTVNMTTIEVEAVQILGSVLVQRKGSSSAVLDLNVPSSYSNLNN
jgi:hypothetical protein